MPARKPKPPLEPRLEVQPKIAEFIAPAPQMPLLLESLWRRRLVFLVCAVAFPALAAVAVRHMPQRFTATGTLYYEAADYAALDLQSILRAEPATDAVMASQAELVRGLDGVAAVTDKLGLAPLPEFNPSLRPPGILDQVLARIAPSWVTPRGVEGTGAGRDRVLAAVRAAAAVEVPRGSRVMAVSFTATDPVLAANAVNLLMQHYLDDQLAAKFAAAGRADDWLRTRAGELRQEVQRQEDAIATYRAQHSLTEGVQASLDTEQASRLSALLTDAKSALAQSEGRLLAASGKAGPVAQAQIAPSVASLRLQAGQLAALVQASQSRYGPNHPDGIALRSQLDEANRAVEAEISRASAAIQSEVQANRSKVAALEDEIGRTQQTLGQSSQDRIALDAMQRNADAARSLLQVLLQRQQQITERTAIERPDARIVSLALPPSQPSEPKVLLIMAFAAAAGVLTGAAAAYGLEAYDTSLRSGEDSRAWFGLPCFGLLPEIGRRQLGGLRVEDYAARKPLSPFVEQVRTLHASLGFRGQRPQIVVITAARSAEGKTATALSLGRVMAIGGTRVLLLDCDIREPSLSKRLGAESEAGLTDLLQGYSVLDQVVRQDAHSPAHFIPAGSPVANSMALFLSDGMTALLGAARLHFDLIVMDAPPVMALSDARAVSRLADACVLCVRWRHTPRRVVRHALDLLKDAGAAVQGLILTRVDTAAHRRAGFADSDLYHPRLGGYFAE
jgi:capsular exopolysaccharide synthesis family protein